MLKAGQEAGLIMTLKCGVEGRPSAKNIKTGNSCLKVVELVVNSVKSATFFKVAIETHLQNGVSTATPDSSY